MTHIYESALNVKEPVQRFDTSLFRVQASVFAAESGGLDAR